MLLYGWLALAGCLSDGTLARCDENRPPVATIQNARTLLEREAVVELHVHFTKHATRRARHFLFESSNFRSPDHLVIAIPDDARDAFRAAGIDDPDAAYRGRRVRARGRLVLDEGQYLLAVTTPQAIEILDSHAPPAPTRRLTVIDDQGRALDMSLPLSDKFSRRRATIEHEGEQHVYQGVPLATLLEHAGVTLGSEARGALLARYVLVTAEDDYRAVLSLAEVDPYFTTGDVLVAETRNGHPLDADEGPLRLVVVQDKHHRRWVKRVRHIEVRNPAAEPRTAD